MENLWGDLIAKKIDTPTKVLEGQSVYLESITNGCVYAEVYRNISNEKMNSGKFVFDFLIKGKYLENYSYKLLRIIHEVNIYPFVISLEEEFYEEIKYELTGINSLIVQEHEPIIDIKNYEQYIEVLKIILSSKKVASIISGIISISD